MDELRIRPAQPTVDDGRVQRFRQEQRSLDPRLRQLDKREVQRRSLDHGAESVVEVISGFDATPSLAFTGQDRYARGERMDDLRNDPEYEIRWPSDVLAAELDRLIARGRADQAGVEWRDEVETLLQQAFASLVPQREFGEQWNQSARHLDPIYGDEEPF